jgi:sigma-B regulation protein RsbU (phosphoserine phosphatase)
LLLGILPDSKNAMAQRVLNAGDLIVIYTDGIVEAEHDEALFGLARLQEVILQNRSSEVKEIQNQIISAVQEYTQGAPQSDDLTLMVLRVTANAPARKQDGE